MAALLLGPALQAQRSHILRLELMDAEALPKGFRLEAKSAGPGEAVLQVEELLTNLQEQGWLTAYHDPIQQTIDSSRVRLWLGKQVEWLYLGAGNVNERTQRALGFKERRFPERPFQYKQVQGILERLLQNAENNGYPFAEARLDSMEWTEHGFSAQLHLDRYRFIHLDSLRVLGGARVAPGYLRQYLGLREGQPYNEAAIRSITTRIAELPFLRESQSPVVRFYGDKAVVGVYLEEINANQFDILLGVLPNSDITGQLALTGELNLQLVNTFAVGERMRLAYRRLQAGTQDLDINLAFPYIPALPVGANLDFTLYLRDSTFLERGTDLGLRYAFGGADFVEGFFENERYVLLDPDTGSIRSSRALPENLDLAVNRYGLALERNRLDYRFNPRKGWMARLRGAAGTREVLENARITGLNDPAEPEFDYATLYDSLSGRVASFRLEGQAAWFIPIGARSTIMIGWDGGFLQGGTLLRNELFRLGGYGRLRGFDEESIFASHFHIGTLEYRFLLATNSAFRLFVDQAWLQERRLGEDRTDSPLGFGAGLDIETGAGIFGLRYALGTQRGNPIAFRAAKIHFGYVNRF